MSTVKVGSDSGAPVFEPNVLTIKAGQHVDFVVSASGGPYNIVFDQDTLPAGAIAEEFNSSDLMNVQGERHTVVFREPGEYVYYSEPQLGDGMRGTIVVMS